MDYLCESINAIFKSSMFSNSLKLADVTPLHTKNSKELKETIDHIIVSILPTLLKIFERIMFAKISVFFDNFSQNINVDFRKAVILNITT